ncbi:MAG: hydroxyacylglutathione hydrolase [bacterium]
MRVVPVPQLFDNYAYLVIDEQSGEAGVVDVSDAGPVAEAAEREGVTLVAVMSTHHHPDHVGGNMDLLAMQPDGSMRVFGYSGDAERIPGITDPLDDGQEFELCRPGGSLGLRGEAIFIPAHTRGHIAYWFADEAAVFTGDTLFAAGCGRLFEGDAAQMKESLERLASLPDETRVYFGHEYTQSNLAFALTLEPGNEHLVQKARDVDSLRAQDLPTVPSTIAEEKLTNPFLRSDSEELRASITALSGESAVDDVAVFAATRRLKDNF